MGNIKSQKATAAYNFIALPDSILHSPLENLLRKAFQNKNPKEKYKQIHENYCKYLKNAILNGYIDLTFETLTPLFIGAADSTFAPTGKPIIPGSSIRGMVKNLFKIITLGAMRPNVDFKDRHLYYRCIMEGKYEWSESLHKEYSNRMKSEDGKINKILPGFIVSYSDKLAICPLKPGQKAERMLISEYNKKFKDNPIKEGMQDVRVEWHGTSAYAISGCRTAKKDGDHGPEGLFNSKDEYDDYIATASEEDKKAIGKQFVRVYHLESVDFREEARILINDKVKKEYSDDTNRRGVDLLGTRNEKKPKNGAIDGKTLREIFPEAPRYIKTIAPCYYLLDGNKVEAFGHGQCFRIPYRHYIGKALPKDLKGDTIDFSDAMFGLVRDKSYWGSRVFFEDAVPEGQICYEEPGRTHPLASPNPTSYQLYLEQKYNSDEKKWEELRHWDSEGARPRGYKLYWHNAKDDAWRAPEEVIEAVDKYKGKLKPPRTQLTHVIKPISKGARFRARIRFTNLTSEELGALMMVFNIEKARKIAYKLGKGKAIGLGSVRIVQKNLLVEDKDQYRKLFTAGGWNNPCIETDEGYYLEKFRKYIEEKSGMEKTWQHIMGELAAMLEWRDEWDKGDVSERWQRAIKGTKYKQNNNNGKWSVDFTPFLRRDVLPTVEDVIKEATETP